MDDNNLTAACRNLKQARKVWGWLLRILAKESASEPMTGMFYQAVVAAVLL